MPTSTRPFPVATPRTHPNVLLLGDGNFSFTLALAHMLSAAAVDGSTRSTTSSSNGNGVASAAHAYLRIPYSNLGNINVNNVNQINNNNGEIVSSVATITATSFDSRLDLHTKYPETREILAELEGTDRFAEVLDLKLQHEVNAWELHLHFPHAAREVTALASGYVVDREGEDTAARVNNIPKHVSVPVEGSEMGHTHAFDTIVWNHPHLGTENFRLHRFLMAHFFDSVSRVLSVGGQVCLTLVQGQELRWSIVTEARRRGFELCEVAFFDETMFPGYVVKRNKHAGSFKATHVKKRYAETEMKSHLLRFVKVNTIIDDETSTTARELPTPIVNELWPEFGKFLGFSKADLVFDESTKDSEGVCSGGESRTDARKRAVEVTYNENLIRGVTRDSVNRYILDKSLPLPLGLNRAQLLNGIVTDLFIPASYPASASMSTESESGNGPVDRKGTLVIDELTGKIKQMRITPASNPKNFNDLIKRSSGTIVDTNGGQPVTEKRPSKKSSSTKPKGVANAKKAARMKDIPEDLICPHCGNQLGSDRAWKQHVHMVHVLKKFGDKFDQQLANKDNSNGADELKFKCDRCENDDDGNGNEGEDRKFFGDQEALDQHIIAKHTTVSKEELAAMQIDVETLPSTTVSGLVECTNESAEEGRQRDRDQQLISADGILSAEDKRDTPDTNTSYIPCPVCLQAVLTGEYGMQLHLETLKPSLGIGMQCPICKELMERDREEFERGNKGETMRVDMKKYPGLKGFIESRALLQHFKFCREKRKI